MTSDSTLDELWAPIAGFENLYEVSTLGRVRSLASIQRHPWAGGAVIHRRGRIMRLKLASAASGARGRGVRSVQLRRDGVYHDLLVSRLVALTFLSSLDQPEDWTVAHKDFDASNCRLDNLEWMPIRENIHRRRSTKLSAEKAQQVVDMYASGKWLQREIAARFDVAPGTISKIILGERWAIETKRERK